MADKTPKPDVGLLINIKRDREHLTLSLDVVLREPGDKIRNPEHGSGYDSLGLHGLARVDAEYRSNAGGLYGWDCEYRSPYFVDLERATRMVKTLRAIDANYRKQAERYGYPKTFSEWVARHAAAIGATWIAEETARGRGYDSHEYCFMDMRVGLHRLDQIEDEAKEARRVALGGEEVKANG